MYSRARFPHQIVLSWLFGVIGLVLGIHYCEVVRGGFQSMTHHQHGVCVGIAVTVFLAVLALNAENNDSRLAGIPKSEFVRVLTGIMYVNT